MSTGPLNKAIGFDGDPGGAYANLYAERMALSSGRLGWHGRGADYLGALLASRPDDAVLRERLANLHWLLLDDPAAALGVLDAAPAVSAREANLAIARATILATANDAAVADGEEALGIAESLVASFPDEPVVHEVHAAAFARAGRFDEAVSALEKAIVLLPAGDDPVRAEWESLRVSYTRGLPKIRGPIE